MRKSGKYKDEAYAKELEVYHKAEVERKKLRWSGPNQLNQRYASSYVTNQQSPAQPFSAPTNSQPGQWQSSQWQNSFAPPPLLPDPYPSQNRTMQRPAREPIKCYNCQKFGHFARDCLEKPAAQGAAPK